MDTEEDMRASKKNRQTMYRKQATMTEFGKRSNSNNKTGWTEDEVSQSTEPPDVSKPATVVAKLKDKASLLTKQTMKNYQVLTSLSRKKTSNQPQRVYMNIVSQNFGVPIIEAVPLTNGGYIPSPQSSTVTATMTLQTQERLLLESQIKQVITWFSGCNTLWAVILIYNLFFTISRLLDIQEQSLFGLDSSNDFNDYDVSSFKVASGIFVAEYIIWLTSIITGIYGLSQLRMRFFRYYTIGLLVSMALEIVGRAIMVSGFAQIDGNNGFKISILVFGTITLTCQFAFLHYSRRLSNDIFDWYDRFG